jgi:hypothetical protein
LLSLFCTVSLSPPPSAPTFAPPLRTHVLSYWEKSRTLLLPAPVGAKKRNSRKTTPNEKSSGCYEKKCSLKPRHKKAGRVSKRATTSAGSLQLAHLKAEAPDPHAFQSDDIDLADAWQGLPGSASTCRLAILGKIRGPPAILLRMPAYWSYIQNQHLGKHTQIYHESITEF